MLILRKKILGILQSQANPLANKAYSSLSHYQLSYSLTQLSY
jgi:hypothetical protein